MQSTTARVEQLHRIRMAVRATLVLGVIASLAANILHASDNAISATIAAWPPLALLLTVELIGRIPVASRKLSALRLTATGLIAGIAAWVSYWHMASVVARYGESGLGVYLYPLSVDGLIVVASISLVELAARIRTAEAAKSRSEAAALKRAASKPQRPVKPARKATQPPAAQPAYPTTRTLAPMPQSVLADVAATLSANRSAVTA